MIIVAVFTIYFGWLVLKGLNGESNSSLFSHPSNFKKPMIEVIAPLRDEEKKSDRIINLLDYIKQKEKEEKIKSNLHLN